MSYKLTNGRKYFLWIVKEDKKDNNRNIEKQKQTEGNLRQKHSDYQ